MTEVWKDVLVLTTLISADAVTENSTKPVDTFGNIKIEEEQK